MIDSFDPKEIIDISPPLSDDLAVFPGDTPFKLTTDMSFDMGHHLKLSSFKSTLHAGAHTDAPCHYHKDGKSIDQVSLSTYLGPCQVIDLSHKPTGHKITKDCFDPSLISSQRVLFKTNSFPDPNKWSEGFSYFCPTAIKALDAKGVRLVGIDTPSVDSPTSKDLPSHNEVYQAGMAILEGITLDKVEEGLYTLIALPLNMKNADASPVRAILVP